MKTTYVRPAAVRRFCKAHGRRTGSDFLATLDNWIEWHLESACLTKDGGKKTLDATVAEYAGIHARPCAAAKAVAL